MSLMPRQKELISLWRQNKLKRITLLEGAVRSGKTYASCVLFILLVANAPKDAAFLMAGRTLITLERNVLELISKLAGRNFSYSLHKKRGELFGRRLYFEGASDTSTEGKIRGMTLSGAYIDEATLVNREFFNMLLSRLSEPDAKLIATTNPDSPNHWLYREFISRPEADVLSFPFAITDNLSLPADYIDSLKKEYQGAFYTRFIEGKWAVADGLVYPMFSTQKHVLKRAVPDTGEFYISVDYGTHNPCSMGLWYVSDGRAYRFSEFYHSGRDSHVCFTDEDYYRELERLAGSRPIQYVICDPSASSFIEVIRRHGRFSVKKANNKVLDGIRQVCNFLANDKLYFSPECQGILREFSEYSWDSSSPEDKVSKESDHAMDDMRYFVMTVFGMRGGEFC